MKIFRLSLFNLRKNKKEALAIIFLTFVTVFLLGTVAANIAKISTVFDDSFEASGSVNSFVFFRDRKYRDEYKEILEKDYGIEDVRKVDVLFAISATARDKNGEKIGYNLMMLTEESDRKLEYFVKENCLRDEEIKDLKHPVWLPQYFEITGGYKPGDTFTLLTGGRDYPFEIAGFYQTGFGNETGMALKIVISEEDYALLSSIFEEDVMLGYNSDVSLPSDEYIEKCEKESSENVSSSVWIMDQAEFKLMETVYLDLFMYISGSLSIITLVAAVFLIRHKIKNDIEDQMQQIGVLEAIGYRSGEISMSYIFEYVITGGSGAVLGGVAAVLFTPVMNKFIRIMMNRNVHGTVNIGLVIIVAIIQVIVITVFALLQARMVKKYPPVVAFRKGIKTHHFGKNFLPLRSNKGNINLRLAMKNNFRNAAQNIGTGVCIAIASVSLLFSVHTMIFFMDGYNGLIALTGMEICDDSITLLDGVDAYGFSDELSKLPEVKKTLVTFDFPVLAVKGSDNSGTAQVYDDFNETTNIPVYKGRYPVHDNEIMISLVRSSVEGYDVGDNIIIEGNGTQKSYVITGIVSGMSNSRMNIYLTTEGYQRVVPMREPDVVQLYLNDGVDQDAFEKKLASLYGAPVSDIEEGEITGSDLEERIRAQADITIAKLIARYGVTDVDYAIKVGDQMITGRSGGLTIKNISSTKDLAKSQMGAIGNSTFSFTLMSVIFIAVVVAVILGIIAGSNVRRQRKELGVMKSMGYSSKDLMTQIALQIMPATVISVVIAAVISVFIQKAFWFYLFGVAIPLDIPVMIVTCISMVIFCYVVTYFAASRVKKISVTELMTE
ncbi:MAG: ABC transporter permease [Clostridiales bacterium]|nr:ABC transporter permease [Clostridiales bacterium]